MTRKSARASTAQRNQKKSTAKKHGAINNRVEVVFVDPPPPSPLRGILPTTPEIEALVDDLLKDRPASSAARQRMVDDFKMQYYFGGHPFVYREPDKGMEVLAVGIEEVGRLLGKRMSQAKRYTLILGHADLWPANERSDVPSRRHGW